MRNQIYILALAVLLSCKDSTKPPPFISGFTPTQGRAGTTVLIEGGNFSEIASQNIVTFGAEFTQAVQSTSKNLTVIVPVGATSGKLALDVNGSKALSKSEFTIPPTLNILSCSPLSGTSGSLITIYGNGFNPNASENIVKFNGVVAVVTQATSSSLEAVVPADARKGPISITSFGNEATSVFSFTVIRPVIITSFSPTSGPIGTRITIRGSGFSWRNVSFYSQYYQQIPQKVNGVVISITETEMVVAPPSYAVTGTITVQNEFGLAESAEKFTVTSTSLFTNGKDFPGLSFIAGSRIGQASFSIGKMLYFGLGSFRADNSDEPSVKDFWSYNTETDTWIQLPDFPGGEREGSASFVINGMGYIVGGNNLNTIYHDVWQFDPTYNTWAKKSDFPGIYRGPFSFVINNMAYLSQFGYEVWQYNPLNDLWTRKNDFVGASNPADNAAGSAASFAINNTGYIVTYVTCHGSCSYINIWSYDSNSDHWINLCRSTIDVGRGTLDFHGFSLKGKGYFTGSLYCWFQYDAEANVLIPIESPLTQIPYLNNFTKDYGASYGTTNSNAYVWSGIDKFWIFTPPN